MGMDVYGIAPVLRGVEPTINWDSSTKEEQDKYWEQLQEFRTQNPGVYFRANLWSWRPIAMIIASVTELYGFEHDEKFLNQLHYNDGGGLKTQAECDKLANFMESYIENHFDGWNSIGVFFGTLTYSTINDHGQMVEKWMDDKESLEKVLHNYDVEAVVSSTLYVKNGEIEHDGILYHTTHSVSKEYVYEFISFLRECGGFQIF